MLFTALILSAPAAELAEWAIRTVEAIDGQIVLRSHGGSGQFRDIHLSDDPVDIDEWERSQLAEGKFNRYATTEGLTLVVAGAVVRVMRIKPPPV